MTKHNNHLQAISVKAPCDLYGRNAWRLNQALTDCRGVVLIEKPDEQRACRAASLLGLLSLGVKKGDTIHLITQEDCGACDKIEGMFQHLNS